MASLHTHLYLVLWQYPAQTTPPSLLSPHTGGGHHGYAGAEATPFSVASLRHLWTRLWIG